jgi:hypothetical protein
VKFAAGGLAAVCACAAKDNVEAAMPVNKLRRKTRRITAGCAVAYIKTPKCETL